VKKTERTNSQLRTLHLEKETLVVLTSARLKQAVGGSGNSVCRACDTTRNENDGG
jgi:hypothetical protein